MEKIYDIAIIGAGPGGSTLARELAILAPNFNILLVDGQSEGRGKVCGGLLSPDAQKLMASFNLTLPKSVLAEDQIFSVETLDIEKGIKRTYQRSYINMDRYAFDNYLLSLVPRCVDIVKGRCASVEKRGDAYSLKINRGGITEHYAKRVVGADGAGSLVRRTFFKDKIERSVAYQEWYSADGVDIPHYSCIFDEKTSRHCSWTIRKGKYVIFGGVFDKEGYKEAFARQKARLEERFGYRLTEPVKHESCFVCNPRKMRDFILGDGNVFLIGEAAGFISPSSYEGISNAMITARALAEALANGKCAKTTTKLYKKATRKQRINLRIKVLKRFILFNPMTRYLVMKSGVQSIKRYR